MAAWWTQRESQTRNFVDFVAHVAWKSPDTNKTALKAGNSDKETLVKLKTIKFSKHSIQN